MEKIAVIGPFILNISTKLLQSWPIYTEKDRHEANSKQKHSNSVGL